MHAPSAAIRSTVIALTASLLVAFPATGVADCDARSGPNTVALVELYTSEGCSSCPSADRQLSSLRQSLDANAEFVPIALHVGYWDYIGWKDAYAQTAFSERQQWLVQANRQTTVYTPQFFVGGSAIGPWHGRLRERVRQINALPAVAIIRLHAQPRGNAALALRVTAAFAGADGPVALYLALAESGLASTVTDGENVGRTLAHDHVVRAWIGPLALSGGGLRVTRELPISSNWNRARLAVVAVLQSATTGRVLQALSAHQCASS